MQGDPSGNKWTFIAKPFDANAEGQTDENIEKHFQAIRLLRETLSNYIDSLIPNNLSGYEIFQFLQKNYGTKSLTQFNSNLSDMNLLPNEKQQDPNYLLNKWKLLIQNLQNGINEITPTMIYNMSLCNAMMQFNPGYEVTIDKILSSPNMSIDETVILFNNEIEKQKIRKRNEMLLFSKHSAIDSRLGKRPSEGSTHLQPKKPFKSTTTSSTTQHDRFVKTDKFNKFCGTHCWNATHETPECKHPAEYAKQFDKPINDTDRPKRKETKKFSFLLKTSVDTNEHDPWYLDTVGSEHITSDLSKLMNPIVVTGTHSLQTANGKIQMTHQGIVEVQAFPNSFTLSQCYYSPEFQDKKINIISIGKLEEKGISFTITDGKIYAHFNGELIFTGTRNDQHVYALDLAQTNEEDVYLEEFNKQSQLYYNTRNKSKRSTEIIKEKRKISFDIPDEEKRKYIKQNTHDPNVTKRISLMELHKAMGHYNTTDLLKMVKNNSINGITLTNHLITECDACLLSKSSKKPFPKIGTPKEYSTGEFLQMDTNFSDVQSIHGCTSTVVVIDYHSKMTFVLNQSSKSESQPYILELIRFLERQTGNKLKNIQKDNGTEFKGSIQKHIEANGIRVFNTLTNESTQNGSPERKHRTLWNLVRACMVAAAAPENLWDEAMNYVVHCINRTPTQWTDHTTTPFELLFHTKLSLKQCIPFGTLAYVHLDKNTRQTRVSPRAIKMMFTGYPTNQKGFRFYSPEQQTFVHSHHCDFSNAYYFTEIPTNTPGTSANELLTTSTEDIIPEPNQSNETSTDLTLPTSTLLLLLTREASQNSKAPHSYKEAQKRYDSHLWMQACSDEAEALLANKTFELVDKESLPPGVNILHAIWIFKLKHDSQMNPIYKARCTINGKFQKYGVDFKTTYSPTISHEAIRMILSFGVSEKMLITCYDVKTAFLNAEIDEDVYMYIPPGFQQSSTKVFKLLKALYGLKQSPRLWNQLLTMILLQFQMTQSSTEPCFLYKKANDQVVIIIFFWVDDICLLCRDLETQQQFEKYFHSQFDTRKIGGLSNFINLDWYHDQLNHTLAISSESYISNAITRFQLESLPNSYIPIRSDFLKANAKEAESSPKVNTELYQQMIGTAIWLSITTRFDIKAAISMLSHHIKDPREFHMKELNRLFGYLQTTKQKRFYFGSTTDSRLYLFSDSDHATDTTDYDSRYGSLIFYKNTLISAESHKIGLIPDSSTEAEYYAMHYTIDRMLWLQKITNELSPVNESPVLFNDNLSAQKIAEAANDTIRSKHYGTKVYRTRKLVKDGALQLVHLPSKDNLADILTKTQTKDLFNVHSSRLLDARYIDFRSTAIKGHLTESIPFSS